MPWGRARAAALGMAVFVSRGFSGKTGFATTQVK